MNILLSLLSAIPAIIAAIRAVESALPMPGGGAAKLDAVLDIVTGCEATFQEHRPQLTVIVSALVALFNKTQVFTK